MGLPPAPPAYDPMLAPAGGYAPPPAPPAPPAPPIAPPGHPSGSMPPPPAAPLPTRLPSGYQPSRAQMMEALKLCQSAVASLQFQDADTAVSVMSQALQVLTPAPPPAAPRQ